MIRICLATLFLFANVTALAEPEHRYIMGSYVNVRDQPSRNANIIDHLIVNTRITLLSESENYCAISWGSDKHGFVACNLIGEKQLRLEDIDTSPFIQVPNPQYKLALQQQFLSQLQDQARYGKPPQPQHQAVTVAPIIEQPNPNYSPLRAFWLEPTVERLFDAGKYFEQTALPADQLNEENEFAGGTEVPELKRAPLQEFEAMKTLLINGIIAPRSQYSPATAWKKIRDLSNEYYADAPQNELQKISRGLYFSNNYAQIHFFQQITLPPARPSFFKTIESIGRPGDGTESLSAQYQIPYRLTVLSNPKWGGDNNSYPLLIGAWDIGEVKTALTKPIYEIALSPDGQLSVGETVAPSKNSRGDSSQYCVVGFRTVTAHRILSKSKSFNPWIFFRLAAPPVLSNAKVTIEMISSEDELNIDGKNTSNSAPSKGRTAKVLTDPSSLEGNSSLAQVDLDGDGAIDLAVWDDGGSGDDLNYRRQRAIFVNVNSEWYLLDTDEIHACGC